MKQAAQYTKGIVAVLGALAVGFGVEVGEETIAQVAAAIAAVLVIFLPNAEERK